MHKKKNRTKFFSSILIIRLKTLKSNIATYLIAIRSITIGFIIRKGIFYIFELDNSLLLDTLLCGVPTDLIIKNLIEILVQIYTLFAEANPGAPLGGVNVPEGELNPVPSNPLFPGGNINQAAASKINRICI